MVTHIASYIAMAGLGDNISKLIQSIIGPIFLVIVGIVSITFLMQRRMMQFLIFIIIAVLVAALIYVPDMVKGLGEGAGGAISWN